MLKLSITQMSDAGALANIILILTAAILLKVSYDQVF